MMLKWQLENSWGSETTSAVFVCLKSGVDAPTVGAHKDSSCAQANQQTHAHLFIWFYNDDIGS